LVIQDQATAILEPLVGCQGDGELAGLLAQALSEKADLVSDCGDSRVAVELWDRAIEIQEGLVKWEGRRELAADLAASYAKKASELVDLDAAEDAVAASKQAILIWQRLIEREGQQFSFCPSRGAALTAVAPGAAACCA
jgi:hypothetical protein